MKNNLIGAFNSNTSITEDGSVYVGSPQCISNWDVNTRDHLSSILQYGYDESVADAECRTGTFARKVFGVMRKHDCSRNFPILSMRKAFFRGAVEEFIWMFAHGDTNILYLLENNINFWTEWPWKKYCNEVEDITIEDFTKGLKSGAIDRRHGDCGPLYGEQFRNKLHYTGELAVDHEDEDVVEAFNFDQYAQVVKRLMDAPLCRRTIVANWSPTEISEMILAPCHGNMIQFNASNIDGEWYLDLNQVQRSQDTYYGEIINSPFYAILLHVTAKLTGMKPRMLNQTINNAHIYNNQFAAVEELLDRPVQNQDEADHCQFEFLGETLEDMFNPELYKLSGYIPLTYPMKNNPDIAI